MKKTIALFFIIGFLVYFQSLFNGFVWDDLSGQILQNSVLYGFDKIPNLIFYHWGYYYKPVFYLVLNFIVTIFGESAFPFHLVQLIIHVANTILLFLLFSKFFKKNISFILALVFLVHPAISEAVLYISALQDVLYPFFGLIALNIVVYDLNSKYKKYALLFLALSLLSKETGIAFIVLVLVYKFLFNRLDFKKYFLFSTIFLSIYLFIRLIFLRISFFNPEFQSLWSYDINLQTRLLTIPQIIFKYLTLFIWPEKLQVFQLWWVRNINFSDFYFPFGIVVVLFILVMFYGLWLYKRFRKESFAYFFFFLFAVTGFLLHLQIIPLDMTFAERWFYLPIIGILGVIGFILNKYLISKRRIKLFVVLSVIIVLALSIRTFMRSFDWHDQNTLVLHDFEVDKKNAGTYFLIVDYYINNKKYDKAKDAISHLYQLMPSNENVDISLAHLYSKTGNVTAAEKIFRNSKKKIVKTNLQYALLLFKEDPKKAEPVLKEALKHFHESHELFYFYSLVLYQMGEKDAAMNYIAKAKKLAPWIELYDESEKAMQSGKTVKLNVNY